MENNMFEIAVREKLRFPYKGLISVEDLWDLNASQLDEVYKTLNAEKKNADEDSLLGKYNLRTKEEQTLALKIDIVKHVFEIKQEERKAREQKFIDAEKKRKILEMIASKEDTALSEKSVDELKEMLSQFE